jgi:hypothetical protein
MQEIRPYRYRQIEEFTLILCQKMGWFVDLPLEKISNKDKEHFCWQNNWHYACASYDFWKSEFG